MKWFKRSEISVAFVIWFMIFCVLWYVICFGIMCFVLSLKICGIMVYSPLRRYFNMRISVIFCYVCYKWADTFCLHLVDISVELDILDWFIPWVATEDDTFTSGIYEVHIGKSLEEMVHLQSMVCLKIDPGRCFVLVSGLHMCFEKFHFLLWACFCYFTCGFKIHSSCPAWLFMFTFVCSCW